MTQPINYASPLPLPPAPRPGLGRGFMGWLLFVALAFLLFVWLKQNGNPTPFVPFSTFYNEVGRGNVSFVSLDADELSGHFRTPVATGSTSVTAFRTALPQGLGTNWEFVRWLTTHTGELRVEPVNNLLVNILLPLVPWLLILGFIWFFVFRQLRRANATQAPMRVVVVNPENPK